MITNLCDLLKSWKKLLLRRKTVFILLLLIIPGPKNSLFSIGRKSPYFQFFLLLYLRTCFISVLYTYSIQSLIMNWSPFLLIFLILFCDSDLPQLSSILPILTLHNIIFLLLICDSDLPQLISNLPILTLHTNT